MRPFNGTFLETVWCSLQRITDGNAHTLPIVLMLFLILLLLPVMRRLQKPANARKPFAPPDQPTDRFS